MLCYGWGLGEPASVFQLGRERGEIPGGNCKSKCEQLVSSLEVKYQPHHWVCWNKS